MIHTFYWMNSRPIISRKSRISLAKKPNGDFRFYRIFIEINFFQWDRDMDSNSIICLTFLIIFTIFLCGLFSYSNTPWREHPWRFWPGFFGWIAFFIAFMSLLPSKPTDKKVKTKADQLAFLSAKYDEKSNSRRPLSEYLGQQSALTKPEILPEEEMLINFYVLGCSLTGYLGPMNGGYFDADVAVQYAVKAGCRAFVLDIDFVEQCMSPSQTNYTPYLVVRKGTGAGNENSDYLVNWNGDLCKNINQTTVDGVCTAINRYAFSNQTCQNSTDPVIIVLNFLRMPDLTDRCSLKNLNYYSQVAKALQVFGTRLYQQAANGNYFRQLQPDQLLLNKITDYNGKVLIFNNADTTGFDPSICNNVPKYEPKDDLNYYTNLQLHYSMKQLGVTDNNAGNGILDSADEYLNIPPKESAASKMNTTNKWTICLPSNPLTPVSESTFTSITDTFGVHCVPITLFDTSNDFMFSTKYFEKYSFRPKPKELRRAPPKAIIPAIPNIDQYNAGGQLSSPTV